MKNSGFTLIEIMIVVIIVAALAVMIVPNIMNMPDDMKVKITRGSMKGIDTALKVYRLENGKYPGELSALLTKPKGRAEPYLDGDAVVDAWDNEYQYKYPGTKREGSYDLHSLGPNGVDNGGTDDDIANWTREE